MTKMPLKENISKVFFVFSQCFFCYYHVSLGAIWYFTRYKKQKKEHIRVRHQKAHGRRLRTLGGASRRPKMHSHHVFRSAPMSFFLWSGVCQCWWSSLSSVGLFSSSPPSHPSKSIVWPSFLLVFQLVLYFLFLFWFLALFKKFYFLYIILSFNPNLPNIIFSNWFLILLISNFFA
jgi:hypothetical protein